MITISKALLSDVALMDIQDEQLSEVESVMTAMTVFPNWKVIKDETGRRLMVFGFIPQSNSNIRLCALVAKNLLHYTTSLFRCIKAEMQIQSFKYPRIETTVKTSFVNGHRYMKLAGFEKECDMENYFNREAYSLYRRG